MSMARRWVDTSRPTEVARPPCAGCIIAGARAIRWRLAAEHVRVLASGRSGHQADPRIITGPAASVARHRRGRFDQQRLGQLVAPIFCGIAVKLSEAFDIARLRGDRLRRGGCTDAALVPAPAPLTSAGGVQRAEGGLSIGRARAIRSGCRSRTRRPRRGLAGFQFERYAVQRAPGHRPPGTEARGNSPGTGRLIRAVDGSSTALGSPVQRMKQRAARALGPARYDGVEAADAGARGGLTARGRALGRLSGWPRRASPLVPRIA